MKMKFMWGALMAIAFASCTQEDVLKNGHGVNTLTASMEKGVAESRVGFTDSQAEFFWTKGDKIGVTTAESQTFQGMTLVGEGGTATGTFLASMNAAASGYAVYPYGAFGRHSVSSDVLSYVLPATYNYESLDATYAKADGNSHNAPMWGKISDGTVNFKHLGGVIAFSISDLPENTENLQFVLTATNQISGSFSATLTENEPKIVTTTTDDVADADKKVTIIFNTAEGQTSGYFYVPVPTGELGTLDLVILNGEDEVATGSWGNVTIARKDIRRATIGNQTIIGGNGEIKLLTSMDQVNNALTTSEENLIVQVSGEVTGDNNIEIPTTLNTETTTFSFASVADGAKITIGNANNGAYNGKIIIEIPVDETLPNIVANIPDGEVYIKQGTVTTLVTSADENTTIIGAKAKIGTLTVVKGNVRIEDGGEVTKIERSDENTGTVYVVYESATVPKIETGEGVVLMSAAEWDLRKAIAEGGKVTLDANIDLSSTLWIGTDCEIDLNGHYIKNANGTTIKVKSGKTLTIGGEGKNSIVESTYPSGAAIWNMAGTLNIKSGTYKNIASNAPAIHCDRQNDDNSRKGTWNLTIEGGTFISSNFTAVSLQNNRYDEEKEGYENGLATIKGGTFEGGNYYDLYLANVNANIDATQCTFKKNIVHLLTTGAAIDGGTDTRSSIINGQEVSLTSGAMNIKKSPATTEEHLKAAVALGGMVTLGADINLSSTLWIGTNCEIDLNNHSIKNAQGSTIKVKSGKTLTIGGEGNNSIVESTHVNGAAIYNMAGTLIINSGTYKNAATQYAAAIHCDRVNDDGVTRKGTWNLTIEGGTFISEHFTAVSLQNNRADEEEEGYKDGMATINGGTFTGSIYDLYLSNVNATISKDDCTFSNNKGVWLQITGTNVSTNKTETFISVINGSSDYTTDGYILMTDK